MCMCMSMSMCMCICICMRMCMCMSMSMCVCFLRVMHACVCIRTCVYAQVALVLNKLGGLCYELGTKPELEEAKQHLRTALGIVAEDALNDTDVSTAEPG
jgi:hypothetical protein